jgi:hypothetical protein
VYTMHSGCPKRAFCTMSLRDAEIPQRRRRRRRSGGSTWTQSSRGGHKLAIFKMSLRDAEIPQRRSAGNSCLAIPASTTA